MAVYLFIYLHVVDLMQFIYLFIYLHVVDLMPLT